MSKCIFQSQPLSELTTAIKDGTHGTHQRFPVGIPLLSAKNVSASGAMTWDENDDRISESEFRDLTRSFQLEQGDLLLTIVGSIGRRAVYAGERVTFQRSVAYIRPDRHKLESRFLFHWMGHPEFTNELIRRSNATAQAGLYLGELAKVSIPIPSSMEQRCIAQILDTLDTAIHETEALIAKLKAVKQGLLHDLLTRGIDANGELRPPQAEAPQLYKESALGWIPKEWEAPLLVEVATRITDGTHQAVVTVTSGGDRVPFLFVSCVRDGKIAWNKSASITDSDYRRISKGREPVKGMTLYTVVGSYGHSAVFDETFDFAFQRHIACIYPDKARVIPEFIPTMLNWEKMRSYADRVALGNAQKTVTLGELSRYPFPLPTKFEQNEIILRLCAVQKTISGELSALKKLQLQKSGLMDDLLTGRVRVTPLLEGHAA
jgi:type I restriction enzyme S subunit